MNYLPPEPWYTLLLDEDHRDKLELALSCLPGEELAGIYKNLVNPQDKRAWMVVGTPLKELTGQHILQNLERIAKQFPKILDALVVYWLQNNDQTLRDFGAGKFTDVRPNPAWLKVAAWLWENTDQTVAPSWGVVATWLEQLNHLGEEWRAQAGKLQINIGQTEVEKAKLERSLRAAQGQHDREQEEILRLKDELQAQKFQVVRLSREINNQQSEIAHLTEERGNLQAALVAKDKLLEENYQQQSRMRSDLFERDQQISSYLDQNHQALDRINLLNQTVDRLKLENQTLNHQVSQLQQRQNLPGSNQILEKALLIDYMNIASNSTQRLIGLFELYRAFLEGKPHPLLEAHTNQSAFTHGQPEGILLLGLEQLLQDGINLPLERFLRTSTFKVEAVLHGLLNHIQSPRLREG